MIILGTLRASSETWWAQPFQTSQSNARSRKQGRNNGLLWSSASRLVRSVDVDTLSTSLILLPAVVRYNSEISSCGESLSPACLKPVANGRVPKLLICGTPTTSRRNENNPPQRSVIDEHDYISSI